LVTVQGKFKTAVCFTPVLEERAAEQIKAVCDQEEFADCYFCFGWSGLR